MDVWRRSLMSVAALVVVFACLSVNVSAGVSEGVSPRFLRIIACANSLVWDTTGVLECSGTTIVQNGYKAGVSVELQQLSGSTWVPIKTWSGIDWDAVDVTKYYSVPRGSYQLKLTHTALDGSNNVVDTFVYYSVVASY